jgi:predicted transcriptional regulator/ribosomal protein S18 acetylase RimI-like enzyme
MDGIELVVFDELREARSDAISDLRRLLQETEDLYPGIDLWFRERVEPGLRDGQRACFVAYRSGEAAGASVIRRGHEAKICSLRVRDSDSGVGIGSVLMESVADYLLRDGARHVHFTIAERVWSTMGRFLSRYGFRVEGSTLKHYRKSEEELAGGVDVQDLARRCKALASNIVLSVKPRFASLIMHGEKTIEIRKSFSEKMIGRTMLIYATAPVKAILGSAEIAEVKTLPPDELWSSYSERLGVSRADLADYSANRLEVRAIFLKKVTPFEIPLPWTEFQEIRGVPIHPPQSYFSLAE